MALIRTTLEGALIPIMGRPSDNPGQKAQEWAQAYHLYALTAMAGVLLPIWTGLEQTVMTGLLVPAMTNPRQSTYQFARAIAGAVEAFWLLPPVLFSAGPVSGVAALFPGKEALVMVLTVILSVQHLTHQDVARQIAGALDAATRTVVVNFAPPPGSTVTLT